MSPTLKRILWVVGGAVALLWLASRRGSSLGGSGSGATYENPGSGEPERAHFSDLEWLGATHVITQMLGYPGCDSLYHHPTETAGTLYGISDLLGITPDVLELALTDIWGGSPLDIQPGPLGGVPLRCLPAYWSSWPPNFSGCTFTSGGEPICPCGTCES